MGCPVQALLEATAKGSFGARMPRHQQVSVLPSNALMRGAVGVGHMHGHPNDHWQRLLATSGHPKPILTGACMTGPVASRSAA